MASGIYQLEFKNGAQYIGKSNDIERRWNEHINKFNKGTAAKAMQRAYDLYGMPKFYTLKLCHPDHIDLMESIYIDIYKDQESLNSAGTTYVSGEDVHTLINENNDLLEESTGQHIRMMYTLSNKIDKETEKYEELLNRDEFVKNLIEEKEKLEYDLELEKQENKKLRNRGFFDYLFG